MIKIIEMCKGTVLENEWYKCFRYVDNKREIKNFTHLGLALDGGSKLEEAVAILEGEPVFADDFLYDTSGNKYFYYKSSNDFRCDDVMFYNQSVEDITKGKSTLSWQPPVQEHEFYINGNKLPCPISINYEHNYRADQVTIICQEDVIVFGFNNTEDATQVCRTIADLLRHVTITK